jgi:hypothetical protein
MPASPKPAKGTYLIERKDRRRQLDAFEDAEKQKVRARDKYCRWPDCADCRRYKTRLEVAHLSGKKMGGDHGLRSTADNLIVLCFLVHQGPRSLHSGDRRITPLTTRGTDGPCQFEIATEAGWIVVHVEDGR